MSIGEIAFTRARIAIGGALVGSFSGSATIDRDGDITTISLDADGAPPWVDLTPSDIWADRQSGRITDAEAAGRLWLWGALETYILDRYAVEITNLRAVA